MDDVISAEKLIGGDEDILNSSEVNEKPVKVDYKTLFSPPMPHSPVTPNTSKKSLTPTHKVLYSPARESMLLPPPSPTKELEIESTPVLKRKRSFNNICGIIKNPVKKKFLKLDYTSKVLIQELLPEVKNCAFEFFKCSFNGCLYKSARVGNVAEHYKIHLKNAMSFKKYIDPRFKYPPKKKRRPKSSLPKKVKLENTKLSPSNSPTKINGIKSKNSSDDSKNELNIDVKQETPQVNGFKKSSPLLPSPNKVETKIQILGDWDDDYDSEEEKEMERLNETIRESLIEDQEEKNHDAAFEALLSSTKPIIMSKLDPEKPLKSSKPDPDDIYKFSSDTEQPDIYDFNSDSDFSDNEKKCMKKWQRFGKFRKVINEHDKNSNEIEPQNQNDEFDNSEYFENSDKDVDNREEKLCVISTDVSAEVDIETSINDTSADIVDQVQNEVTVQQDSEENKLPHTSSASELIQESDDAFSEKNAADTDSADDVLGEKEHDDNVDFTSSEIHQANFDSIIAESEAKEKMTLSSESANSYSEFENKNIPEEEKSIEQRLAELHSEPCDVKNTDTPSIGEDKCNDNCDNDNEYLLVTIDDDGNIKNWKEVPDIETYNEVEEDGNETKGPSAEDTSTSKTCPTEPMDFNENHETPLIKPGDHPLDILATVAHSAQNQEGDNSLYFPDYM